MNIFIHIEKKGKIILKKIFARLLSPAALPNRLKKGNVIVVRIDERMGNLVLLNAVVKSFIKNNIKITLVICKKYGEIYKFNPDIDRIIYFNKKSLFNPLNIIKLILNLRKQAYDLMFDASNPNDLSLLTFFVMLLIKAGIKLGYERRESKNVLNKLIPIQGKHKHIMEYYADLFRYLNLKFIKDFSFTCPEKIKNKYNYLKENNKTLIIVHPGGQSSKHWRIEKLLAFLEKIKSKRYKFIILLGPDEYDVEKLFSEGGYSIIKPKNIMDLASLFHAGRIYLGNDSGPMHLAVSLKLTVFAIFKPIANDFLAPQGKDHEIIVTDNPSGLSVEAAFKRFQKFIKRFNKWFK